MAARRILIVNADDFGFTRDVNAGIVQAHRTGILTATTLMANGAAFNDAVCLARQHPSLDVGCHLVLVGGPSLSRPGQALPASIQGLLLALARRDLDIEKELELQLLKLFQAGIQPTHLDTHKHTHFLPPVLNVVANLAVRYQVPWVRRPIDFPLQARQLPWTRRLLSGTLGLLGPHVHRVLSQHGCRTTDHFAGFRFTGSLKTRELIELLEQLPVGVTELMTHPGYCSSELLAARTRLKESREEELKALIAPETQAAIQRLGIELSSFRDLR
ncbi:MAG: ChbG/HpnK family deacetylase [Bryobacteraceae bacterium]|nr:ChbG/HpnK family deacetylase [Bryobacteraceae bacterium]MDW8379123.1 ChbG/HpnK family deacetylase [Bryobacterales bacterium]